MAHPINADVVVNLTQVDNTAQAQVGLVVQGTDQSEFVYVQAGSGGLAQYDLAAVNKDGSAVKATAARAAAGDRLGVAQVAINANQYGWVQTKGALTVNATVGAVAAVPLYTTGTAGVVDDAVGTIALLGLRLLATSTGETTAPTAAFSTGIVAIEASLLS